VYVELHTSSAFSFLRAASTPETLIECAATLGYPAVALLDRDGVSGAPRFHKAALAAGIRPLIGAELTIAPGTHEITRSLDHQIPITRSPDHHIHPARSRCLPGRLAQPVPPALAYEVACAEGRRRADAR
jgi:DNA polymerase III alpha subunit